MFTRGQVVSVDWLGIAEGYFKDEVKQWARDRFKTLGRERFMVEAFVPPGQKVPEEIADKYIRDLKMKRLHVTKPAGSARVALFGVSSGRRMLLPSDLFKYLTSHAAADA